MLLYFAFPLPLLIAGYFGFREGSRDPQSVREFWLGAAWAFGWALLWIFLWQALWLFAFFGSDFWDGIIAAAFWTALSGCFWLPVLMISYVMRASAMRRRGRV